MMINPMNKSITEYAELIIITNKTKKSSLIRIFIVLLGYLIFVIFVVNFFWEDVLGLIGTCFYICSFLLFLYV